MPLRTLLRKAPPRLAAIGGAWLARVRDHVVGSYAARSPDGQLAPLLGRLGGDPPAESRVLLETLSRHYRAHRFDLLGSGWLRVGYAGLSADRDGRWLRAQVSAANLGRAQSLWRLVDPGYEPIDWQLDFKSGYRWSATRRSDAMPTLGNPPGVDIKLPWELARCQHLPQLALAHLYARDRALTREFRNQVLDFMAQNPPRFGANWVCTMDVAIRIANWLVAYDLFRSAGAEFDAPFEDALLRSTYEHARHIASHLEWHESLRGNHYLADVSGLLFAAAALPSSRESDQWLAFAAREVLAESERQFYPEGTNFEASTAYHRLSAEFVLYSSALMLGRGLELPRWLPARVAGMARFTVDLARRDGTLVQFGDNDSGRFFKLPGAYRLATAAALRQRYRHLDGWHELDDAGLCPDEEVLDQGELAAMTRREGLAGAVVSALARGRPFPPSEDPAGTSQFGTETTLASALADIGALPITHRQSYRFALPSRGAERTFAYPRFGAFGWRHERWSAWIRCGGPLPGMGGHAHNDALALELEIDGVAVACDPGTYAYTPWPQMRNRYRSAAVHFVPRIAAREPASLDEGLFAKAPIRGLACLYFGAEGFAGAHTGFGEKVMRAIVIEPDAIRVEDGSWGEPLERCQLPSPVPVSPKYGALLR